VAPDGVAFPDGHQPWVLAFSSDCFTLGRRTLPGDPGISRQHADIIRTPEGRSVVDRGSLNGTTVNDEALAPNAPRPIGDGDRVRLGAWTMLTIRIVAAEDDDDDD